MDCAGRKRNIRIKIIIIFINDMIEMKKKSKKENE